MQRDTNNKQFSNRIILLHKSQYESNIAENRKKISF